MNGAASARVVFIHTRTDHLEATGDVTIHDYVSEPHRCRFVGNSILHLQTQTPKILKLTLMFRNVGPDAHMTVRCQPEHLEQVVGSLFSHSVTVSIPLSSGEHDIELSFGQRDVQYQMSNVELLEKESQSDNEITTEREWIPFLKRGGVRFLVGSGWFLPLPDLETKRPFTHTAQNAYLLLIADEPGDYELRLPWLRSHPAYGPPSLLLDGNELPLTEVTPGPPVCWTRVRLHLEKEHVFLMRLNDRITSPLSHLVAFDLRFLGYQVPWNQLEIRKR